MPKIIMNKDLTIANVKDTFEDAKKYVNKQSRSELDALKPVITQIDPREADRMETAFDLLIEKIEILQNEFFERLKNLKG